jgi:hypothetical protein
MTKPSGNQALENLHAGVRVIACQHPNLLLTFKHCGSAAPATDALTVGNSSYSWVRATPLSAKANEYAPIFVNVASLS